MSNLAAASARILLAEDDNDMRRFLVKALQTAGYSVASFDNGLSAYNRLREEPFELLLTDIVMPEMDGIELARRASEARPDLPILLVTGYSDLPPGGQKLPRLSKPFSLADLAVVTKIDRVSQAEREVFRARILDAAPQVRVREVNALYGIGVDPIADAIALAPEIEGELSLRGNPPLGACTICVGKKTIGWQSHFGVVRSLDNQTFYRGE